MRYFFEIAYNGKNYNGWQSQNNALGVQSVVEDAFSKLLQETCSIVASGRTDTGVHCEQQFFHLDLHKQIPGNFLIRINSFLPADVVISSVSAVREDASARYDAVQRSYRYQITRKKNPFLQDYAWHFFKELDMSTMKEATALLVGEQDFECFSKVHTDVNHFLCKIHSATWSQRGDLLIFEITANRFLRGMVRAVVGTLLDVGSGKIGVQDFEKIIKGRDRRKAGANVPPQGLFLTSVKYPSEVFIG